MSTAIWQNIAGSKNFFSRDEKLFLCFGTQKKFTVLLPIVKYLTKK
jgi:hypothetical protein